MQRNELLALVKEAKRVDERIAEANLAAVNATINNWLDNDLPFLLKQCIDCNLTSITTSLKAGNRTQEADMVGAMSEKLTLIGLDSHQVVRTEDYDECGVDILIRLNK